MRTRSLWTFALPLALLVLITVQSSADPATRQAAEDAPSVTATVTPAVEGVPEAVGTITYDNNVPFQRDGQVNGTIGNRFDPSMNPHTLTTVTFRVAGNYGASVVASVWQPGAGTANILRRWIVNGVPSGTVATGSTLMAPVATVSGTVMPITAHSGSFIAGIRNTAYTGLQCAPPSTGLNTTCDGVALTQGTATIGGGVRGARIQFTDGAFLPTVATVNSTGVDFAQNAIMRATGDNLPVELMNFSID